MLITALMITDYKRVRKVAIKPDADRSLILLGGRNRQGKSSTIDALTAAFGGAKAIAADPVRHGADQAAIRVELDGGQLTIERVIRPDGTTTLEVRDADGAVRRPQETLDKLIGARFLDPLRFLRLDAKEQRAQLMRLIPDAARIDELNGKRERAFAKRTEVGRELTRARGELERLPPAAEPIAPIDVAALVAEQRAFSDQQRAGDGLGNAVSLAEAKLRGAQEQEAKTHDRIAALERELVEARSALAGWGRAVAGHAEALAEARQQLAAAAAAWTASAPRRTELERDLSRAGEHNRQVGERSAADRRRAETAAAVDQLEAKVTELSGALATIDQRKAEVLGAAKLPVEGLEIRDDGIALAGVPFGQASASEQLRVALALAIAGSPGLHDVWVRDGALFDEDALEELAKLAAAAGKRVWVERVGTRDPGVIVIQDGEVA